MSLLFFLFLLSLSFASRHVTAGSADTTQYLLKVSCSRARYGSLCVKNISPFALSVKTPSDLANASVSVALDLAQEASAYVSRIAKRGKYASDFEKKAIKDCAEELSDSVDEVRRTLSVLGHMRPGKFQWQMSNAQTWVSAALTDVDTCVDGFESIHGGVKEAIRKRIRHVARVTSNTLCKDPKQPNYSCIAI